jgi:hypothetical protein
MHIGKYDSSGYLHWYKTMAVVFMCVGQMLERYIKGREEEVKLLNFLRSIGGIMSGDQKRTEVVRK